MIIDAMNTPLNGIALLPHLGVIRVQGADAAAFLQGQLTQDFALLGLSQARLAAFCSAKGRVQATFIGFKRDPQDILLVCSLDLLPAVLKRLSMFVLRAKCKLTDASSDFQLRGIAGPALARLTAEPGEPWSKRDLGAANIIHLYPADGVERALWVAPIDEPAPVADTIDTDRWLLAEVHAGVATISAPLVDAFVPQMLNYESIGGVNFKKGCYPGQEVVARSQFRGVLKRRAMLAHCETPMVAGQEIYQRDDAEHPCGTVVQAARAADDRWDAIVSGQVSAMLSGAIHLGAAVGPALVVRAMPYPLLDDI